MGLHGGEWRVHASAVDDTALIVDSMQWLCGDSVEISIESEKSALGAIMYTIVGKMNSKASKEPLGRVCNDSLKEILSNGIASRVDENKNLHIRLGLASLVRGEAVVAGPSGSPVAKGKFKLEVYPGQEAASVAESVIAKMVD